MTLNNGASVLAVKPSQNGFIVLAKFNGSFVTWSVDNDMNAYWGHYFETMDEALEDFNIRK
jgi:hypothetical protein